MMMYKPSIAFIASFAVIHTPGVASNSPYVISDDRVRSLDISPALGRGYSIMTNTFQSTCLVVDKVTVPSYNYDYFFTEISSSSDVSVELGGKISGSLSYGFVSAEASVEATGSSTEATKTQITTATMKIERYYSSVREEVSPLAEDAFSLLQNQDYVGFFKSCGPNYVRSLRRAQEVTALFKFESSSSETAAAFSASLKASAPGVGGAEASVSSSSKFSEASSSMTISIVGFGMGLTQDGSETLVATSLSEYQGVMKFAFNSMTKSADSANIGMVYGMEVVPWVNNVSFQVAAQVSDQVVLIPLPRSLIARAEPIPDANGVVSTEPWTQSNHETLFRCKDTTLLQQDKYGFCCEFEQLYHPVNRNFPAPAVDCPQNECVCKPSQNLDKSLVKENMSNNGEFVARLDMSMRYKLVTLGSLEKCISAANAFPDKYRGHIIKSNDSVKYDKEVDISMSLLELKKTINPLDDYGLVKMLGREMDEWLEMYYSPCLSALYGMNVGATASTDVSYFMAYAWHTHPECAKLSCLTSNMRWDRKEGGCAASGLTGATAMLYEGSTDAHNEFCALDGSSYGATQTCKYLTADIHAYATRVQTCWATNAMDIQGGVDYLMNHFCNPVLTKNTLTEAELTDKDTKALLCV